MKIVIVGGTGTLGTELVRQLEPCGHDIVILSRDELKQKELKAKFPDITCQLGDIREKDSLYRSFSSADVVFHVAALKNVDVLEDNPEECVKTNILGTINVADVAEKCNVSYCVFSSTDKAVDPCNVYGMSKAVAEKILFNRNKYVKPPTIFSVFRWGNIASSRGAALHFFKKTLLEENKVYITSRDMTRFWLRIEDAASYMLETYRNAPKFEACIPDVKSASVMSFVECLAEILGVKDYGIDVVGVRPGEKIHEVLISQHEGDLSSQNHNPFTREELKNFISGCL